jgi:membrane protein YdbS with pleckstrin-like domain
MDSRLTDLPQALAASKGTEDRSLNPVQFSIAELFWLSISVAVLLAIAAPFLRQLPPAMLGTAVFALAIQSIAIAVFAGMVSHRRKQMLERSGKRIALGSSSESPSAKWSLFWSIVSIAFTIALQVYISVGLFWALSNEMDGALPTLAKIVMVLCQSIGPVFVLKQSIRFLRWRIRSDAVEFFENGVAIFDLLRPWSKVELRRSQFHSNRIMVYYRENQTSVMVWLDQVAADHLLAFATNIQAVKQP